MGDSTSPHNLTGAGAWVAPRVLAGRYRIGRRMGAGSQATVHEALDQRSGRSVAIKLVRLPAEVSVLERAQWLNQAQRQVHLAGRIRHPDVLDLVDAGMDHQHLWMVGELVRGRDLSHYILRHRLLPEVLVLQLAGRVAAALAHAHERGVIHRDLKPANVLLNLAQGVVKLADFGVARMVGGSPTQTGTLIGTPSYMAPEVLAGSPSSAAADCYALGVLVFELFTAQRPHRADSLGELLRAMTDHPPRRLLDLRPDLPPAVQQHLERLLAVDPADRPTDAGALRQWAVQAQALASVMTRAGAAHTATAG